MRLSWSGMAVALGLAPACWPATATVASTDLASMADVVARYPKTEMNATAVSLVRLGADLGLDLEPWTFTPDWCRKRSPADTNQGMWSAILGYLQGVREEPESNEPPPPALLDFSSSHRGSLEAIRDLLIREPTPRWEFDIEAVDGPQPSLRLGRLRSLLLAEALAAVNAGDSRTGLAWLEAAWNLDEGLRSSPYDWGPRSPQALAIVRRLEPASEVWTERLARYDGRTGCRAGQLVQVWTALQVLAQDAAPLTDYLDCCLNAEPDPGWVQDVRRFVLTSSPVRAYGRAGTVEAAARLRTLLDRLVQLDPCELIAGDYPDSIDESDPWWNRMGQLIFVSQRSIWGRVGRVMLEAELTSKVLEARRQRAQTGSWPESIPGIEDSACARGSWRYSAPRGGGVLLEFVTDGDWPLLHEPGPLRFCLPR